MLTIFDEHDTMLKRLTKRERASIRYWRARTDSCMYYIKAQILLLTMPLDPAYHYYRTKPPKRWSVDMNMLAWVHNGRACKGRQFPPITYRDLHLFRMERECSICGCFTFSHGHLYWNKRRVCVTCMRKVDDFVKTIPKAHK